MALVVLLFVANADQYAVLKTVPAFLRALGRLIHGHDIKLVGDVHVTSALDVVLTGFLPRLPIAEHGLFVASPALIFI